MMFLDLRTSAVNKQKLFSFPHGIKSLVTSDSMSSDPFDGKEIFIARKHTRTTSIYIYIYIYI